ncbi:hypothetical protein, partial [Arthrobacter flavus]
STCFLNTSDYSLKKDPKFGVQLLGTTPLLRQYLAKGADLRQFSMRDLDDIRRANQHPTAPRTGLGHLSSLEIIFEVAA